MLESRLVTEIWFADGQGFDPRSECVFSDSTKVRLDPKDFRLKLKLDETSFRYPTDADLSIRSPVYAPSAIRAFEKLQVVATVPEGTSIGLRIWDGTNELYFDGGAWSTAGAGDWNTEAEINQNLSTFDISSREFAIVVNLVTTDDTVTPEVEAIFMAWRGPVDFVDDILNQSLVQMFRDELVFTVDAALPPLPADSSSIDLDDYVKRQGNLDIRDVDAVFDHTSDPNHLTDLLLSYDAGTKVATLSSTISAGNVPYFRLRISPQIAWSTHQDYEEVSELPQVVFGDADSIRSSEYPSWATSSAVRKDDGTAVEVPPPLRQTYQITAELRTDRTSEQRRLEDAFYRLLLNGPSTESGPFLRSIATARRYRIWLVEELRSRRSKEGASDMRVSIATFRLEDVALNLRPSLDAYMIQSIGLKTAAVQSDEIADANEADRPVTHTVWETIDPLA